MFSLTNLTGNTTLGLGLCWSLVIALLTEVSRETFLRLCCRPVLPFQPPWSFCCWTLYVNLIFDNSRVLATNLQPQPSLISSHGRRLFTAHLLLVQFCALMLRSDLDKCQGHSCHWQILGLRLKWDCKEDDQGLNYKKKSSRRTSLGLSQLGTWRRLG